MATTTTTQRDAVLSLLTKAGAALNGNVAYLALTTPSNAQNTAQLKALTRQVNALIRLTAGMYGEHGRLADGPDT